jgi:hypothetical protein
MTGQQELVARIDSAFVSAYPGDAFLVGSTEGCEPQEEAGAFIVITDWRTLTPEFLDGHYSALGFFSEAGLRSFLPAYLVSDVRGELMTADPTFHLVHGFHELLVDTAGPDGVPIHHRSGGRVLLGARRYGAITWEDACRHRMSVFCREEAQVIVAYLEWRRDTDDFGFDRSRIDAALERFWHERRLSAPRRSDLGDDPTYAARRTANEADVAN